MDLSLSGILFDLLRVVLTDADCAPTIPLDVDGCAVSSECPDLFLVLLSLFDALGSSDVEIETCALSSEVSDLCHFPLLFFAASFSFDFEVEFHTLSSEVSDNFLLLCPIFPMFNWADLDFFPSFEIPSDVLALDKLSFVASS